jgi:zinc protease
MIPVVEQDWIDGVPVLRADAPSGRHMAALVFRVGRFDETLPAAGVTHMVEHLALADKREAPYSFNASVNGRFTIFYMESGDAAHIGDFVASVCRGLTSYQGAVLDRERRILRTEAASRGGAGGLGNSLAERYGATGPGLANYQEFGLYHLGWTDVETWRRQWFTSGNAVLWIAGSPPDGLRLSLSRGTAPLPGALRPLGHRLPGFVVGGRGGIGMSLAGPRSVDAHLTVDVLQRRLTQVLRHEHGLSYDAQCASGDLDRDLVHTWVAADALPEHTPMAAHSMLSAFESLAEDGCGQAEIDDYGRRLRDAYESPSGPVMVLQRRAQDILSGRPERDPAETLRIVAGLDAKTTGAAARALYDAMIMVTPGVLPAVQGRMPQLPIWSESAVWGREHKSVDSDAILATGDLGVTLAVEAGHQVTVRYDSVAALLRWNDGKQALVGTDGFAVHFDPDEWPDGQAILTDVAAHVSPGVIVPVDAPGPIRPGRRPAPSAPDAAAEPGTAKQGTAQPGTAQPGTAQPGTAQPGPPYPTEPTAPGPRRSARSWPARILQAVWVLFLITGILAIAGGDLSGGFGFAVIGAAGIAWQEFHYRHRQHGPQ